MRGCVFHILFIFSGFVWIAAFHRFLKVIDHNNLTVTLLEDYRCVRRRAWSNEGGLTLAHG